MNNERQIYLDDEHVDDSDVLDMRVGLELDPQLLPATFDVDRKFVPVHHGGDVAPPSLVERAHSDSSLGIVQRQEGLHLQKECENKKHLKLIAKKNFF